VLVLRPRQNHKRRLNHGSVNNGRMDRNCNSYGNMRGRFLAGMAEHEQVAEGETMLKGKDKYTVITFKDGREILIKGYDKADAYAAEHADEIAITYTDHTGSEHLERYYTEEKL